jgi:hypothetical protein
LIIGILSFQLWSKTTDNNQTLEQIEKILEKNNMLHKQTCDYLKDAIDKNTSTNPNKFSEYQLKSVEISSVIKAKMQYLDRTYFNLKQGQNITLNTIKDSLKILPQLFSSITHYRYDSLQLAEKYALNRLLYTDIFTNGIKKCLPLYINVLKNQIQLDAIVGYDFLLDKVSGRMSVPIQKVIIAIFPKKASLIEGEKFEADICLASYSTYPGNGVIITVNNQNLPIKDGIARYTSLTKTTGIKTIKAQASIKNPATGEVTTVNNQYEYQVLPKCSRDCQ